MNHLQVALDTGIIPPYGFESIESWGGGVAKVTVSEKYEVVFRRLIAISEMLEKAGINSEKVVTKIIEAYYKSPERNPDWLNHLIEQTPTPAPKSNAEELLAESQRQYDRNRSANPLQTPTSQVLRNLYAATGGDLRELEATKEVKRLEELLSDANKRVSELQNDKTELRRTIQNQADKYAEARHSLERERMEIEKKIEQHTREVEPELRAQDIEKNYWQSAHNLTVAEKRYEKEIGKARAFRKGAIAFGLSVMAMGIFLAVVAGATFMGPTLMLLGGVMAIGRSPSNYTSQASDEAEAELDQARLENNLAVQRYNSLGM